MKLNPHAFSRHGQQGGQPTLKLAPIAVAVTLMMLGVATNNTFAAEANNEAATVETNAGFDMEMLKSRGIDPKVAEYFKDAPRYRPGISNVTLLVNGSKKGTVAARFDEQGNLCFDSKFMARAGLQLKKDAVPAKAAKADEAEGTADTVSACEDFMAAWPEAIVKPYPNTATVELIVPTDALRPEALADTNYTTGGTAALLNYDLLAIGNQGSGSSSQYFSGATELGFNAGDWIVRNRSMYTNDGKRSQFEHLYAYAQRTFTDYKSVFQTGEINVSNSIFSGMSIDGAQWVPEAALTHTTNAAAQVTGIAQSTARVEVRQAAALIYSTVVPPGPFSLSNLPLLNGTNDLEVTVIEADGSSRKFIVPAASLSAGSLGIAPGYSAAVGRLRDLGDNATSKPWMATGTGTWSIGKSSSVTAGVLGATEYQSIGFGGQTTIFDRTAISAQSTWSNATREGLRGGQATASISTPITQSLSLNASASLQTPGYRTLTDTTQDTTQNWNDNHYRSQYTASAAWLHPWLGGFTAGYTRSDLFNGQTTQRVTGSWGRTFKYATVNLNIEHSLGGGVSGNSGNSVYLTATIPFGKRSVKTYVNSTDGNARVGATYSEVVSDELNYSLNAELQPNNGTASSSANASITPHYTQMNVGVSQNGTNSTSYNAELRGGVVAHKHGVTFSPYPVADTFGIAKTSDVAGVKISTPQGPVWTDFWGQAVIPSEAAYSTSRIEVSGKTLPRNVDIGNGFAQVNPGRGSVNYVNFDIVKVRRILLRAIDKRGQVLPKNASVLDKDDNYLTTVLDDGNIFLNGNEGENLKVVDLDGNRCSLEYKLAEKPDLKSYFENAEAVCR
ncbi:fimbrial biogenesis usher protein [Paraburkholderia sartisoli]|uniref:Outer membrane usher protein FimD/PapC n=1 Tax=Paraburkholderia sartisoli TaxID=83784 RepID=A0A1H4G4C5_9BURK|nr:fimbrial biogenesis usher protein [Paraburkholderia sartisoli]SEB04404.1 Outer membrane usher protein FimD/PapC [Paraburkholderia sartisoli]